MVNLLQDIQSEFGVAFLFIAHDLAIVRHFCPEIAVMYLGKIVEIGDRESIYNGAHHPYTQALLSAVPDVKQAAIGGRRERIQLEGDVPSPINPPSGCRFRTRCPLAQEICAKHEPPLLQIGPKHKVACHFPGRIEAAPGHPDHRAAARCRRRGQPRPGGQPEREAHHAARLRRHLVRPGQEDVWTSLTRSSTRPAAPPRRRLGRDRQRVAERRRARLGAARRPDAAAHARRARRAGAAARARARRCASWSRATSRCRCCCGDRPAPARPRSPRS